MYIHCMYRDAIVSEITHSSLVQYLLSVIYGVSSLCRGGGVVLVSVRRPSMHVCTVV